MGAACRTWGFKTSRTMFNIPTLAIFSTLVAVNVVHSKSAELVSRINRASTDVTVEGWMRGETSIIGAHADEKNFFMEFVATGARFSFLGFQDFFDTKSRLLRGYRLVQRHLLQLHRVGGGYEDVPDCRVDCGRLRRRSVQLHGG